MRIRRGFAVLAISCLGAWGAFALSPPAGADTIPPTGPVTVSIAPQAAICTPALQTCTQPWVVSAHDTTPANNTVTFFTVLYPPHPAVPGCNVYPFTVATGGCITYLTPDANNDGTNIIGTGSANFTQSGVPCGTTEDVSVDLLTANNAFPSNPVAKGYPFYDLAGSTTTPTCPVTPTVTTTSATVCDQIVGTYTDNVTLIASNVPTGVTGTATLTSHTPAGALVRVPLLAPITGNGSYPTGLSAIPGSSTSASMTFHVTWSNGTTSDVTATTSLAGTCVIPTTPTTTPPTTPTPAATTTASVTPAVTATAAPATTATAQKLAFTGAALDVEVALGLMLVAAGALMVRKAGRKVTA